MNVRELCRLLSATLHLPGVDRWAEQLVRRELLPGLDHETNALDAAVLLAAVVAAPRPEDAPRVVVTLAGLPLIFLERNVESTRFPTWVPGTDDDIAAIFVNPLEALAAAIEEAPDPEGKFVFGSVEVAEGGVIALIHGRLGAEYHEYQAGYTSAGARSRSGITRSFKLHGDVIQVIADALWPATEHVVGHDKSTLTLH